MERAPLVCIVDDDAAVRETFGDYLQLHGLAVELLDGGPALRERLGRPPSPDVVLLDITMPGEDGLSLARHVREVADAGIIMVTARGDTIDRVVGLELGADDYLAKPVELRELLARIRALLRRSARPAETTAASAESLRVGDMTLHLAARRLTDAAGRVIPLTAMEFDLLRALAERPGQVLSRDRLLELAHKDALDPFDRSIDIRIARLRRKIERDPARPALLKTVRGVGYVLEPQAF
jgi:two-component system phosphate regulon response regulator OmpR